MLLIVDDNMCFIERMIGLLDDSPAVGYINVATDYDEASRFVNEERPDLVLLDINLPGKNGIELLKMIKKPGDDACKVIMITNHADDYYRQQCNDLGADYFLDKSNDFGKVPSIIDRLGLEMNPAS